MDLFFTRPTKEYTCELGVKSETSVGPSSLLYATSGGVVCIWDLILSLPFKDEWVEVDLLEIDLSELLELVDEVADTGCSSSVAA